MLEPETGPARDRVLGPVEGGRKMKRIFSQKTLILVLALGLTASLTLNIALFQKQREEVPLDLRG